MLIRLRAVQDRLRSSLFFIPMLFVVFGAILGEVMLTIDERVNVLPERLLATVDSARSVLSVIAGATLSFAGIAFSVSLLLISLASSQYSPRVIHGLFRDPFNKRVMGVVIGTFTYCLIVMRMIRGPLEEGGNPVVPSLAILLAVVLGIVSILAIVAFISHSAHTMDVSSILQRVTDDAIATVRSSWENEPPAGGNGSVESPEGDGYAVTFDRSGWVQQVDHEALLACIPVEGSLRLETVPGRYAIPNTRLCTVWPVPDDPDGAARAVRSAVGIGDTRTMQQDVTYGLRQLADVALKALSPGINDPTTAQDAIFHLGAVLRELLITVPPARRIDASGGRSLLLAEALTHADLIGLAFDEIRLASAGQPTVQVYLLEVLHLLDRSLDPGSANREPLRRQADLILDVDARSDLPGADHERVWEAHRRRFTS